MSTGRENRWLAEMGYATWRKVIDLEIEPELRGTTIRTLEDAPLAVQHAWEAAAAAIRRRVVNWSMPAEEGEQPTRMTPQQAIAMLRTLVGEYFTEVDAEIFDATPRREEPHE